MQIRLVSTGETPCERRPRTPPRLTEDDELVVDRRHDEANAFLVADGEDRVDVAGSSAIGTPNQSSAAKTPGERVDVGDDHAAARRTRRAPAGTRE